MPVPEPSPEAQWKTLAAQAQTLQGSPGSTIEPRHAGTEAAATQTISDAGDAARLELGHVLGEGGMGVVRQATQRSMGRQVAVKALRPGRRAPEPTRKLLQEAWTTGRLEHPNIIPIYDIAIEDDGNPLIVLKRIEGESWSVLLTQPERAAALVDGADALARNLRILDQVCRALHFAHARGVLHLDLKPDNVMLGEHGEVYLVDWGVAMAMHDDGRGQLPLTTEHRGLVGTPCYMAPEMLEGDGRRLGPHTDVYLLGATLYELLAGHPPHRGETIMEVLHTALMQPPPVPAQAPAELAGICERAMARDPAKRYGSVEQLRQALLAFELHRESARIAQRAAEQLGKLEAERDRTTAAEPSFRPLFAQARFGFEQALDSWPDNEAATRGLARAFEVMVQLELERGDPQVSAALAREAPSLSDELQQRVDEAVQQQQASLQELESRRRDQDLSIGQRTRGFVSLLMGAVWTIVPGLEYFFAPPRVGMSGFIVYALVPVLSIMLLLGLFVWARDSLTRTRANRVIVAALFLALGSHLAVLGGFGLLGLPPRLHLVVMLLVWAVITIMLVITVERRALPIAVTYLLGFFVAATIPDHTLLIVALCDLVFAVVVTVIWRPEPAPEPDPSA
ncbi:MAG: serine/threonine-protein kinase [Nannocystaceae bacterium]